MTDERPDDTDYEHDLRLAWELLDRGDAAGGAEAVARLPAEAFVSDPDAIAVTGHLAVARGELDEAVEILTRAGAIAPDATGYTVHAARVELELRGEPERAIALCDRALEAVIDDEDFAGAIVIKAEATLAAGGTEADARALLDELAGCRLRDPDIGCRAGELSFDLGDLAGAERAFRDAIAAVDEWPDAHYGLGCVHSARGRRAEATAAWVRTRELDLASPRPPWHMTTDEFEHVAERALAELPREVLDRLENVPVLIDDMPSVELIETGIEPRLLGLFSGTPLPHKTHEGQVPAVDTVHLYQRNLERACESRDELAEEIRITVLHETAHFFGLEDDDLDELGLG